MLRHLKFSKTNTLQIIALGAFLTLALNLVLPQATSALSGSDYKAGRIIDDAVFYNSNSMSSAQIQQFLETKVPVCDTNGEKPYASTTRADYGTSRGYPPPYTCLKDYRQDITAKNPEDSLCGGMSAASNVRASEIIYRVAQSCGVSPKVMIVLLQKEQSLVTDDWPWSIQYRSATGYGCPDSGPNYSANCDASYYGFYNQVYMAARVFKYYAKYPSSFNHIAGRNNYILYNPNTNCGGTSVFIENQATAGLYNYTPYQPNAAALNNLYGTGDSCSAYGNRNFWRMFNDWFGAPRLPTAIKSSNSAAVYLHIEDKKFAVPSMAVLQDHGISPTSIKTVPQSTLNAIPSPDSGSGLSSSIGFLVKSPLDSDSDGGSVYFISIGKRYKVKDMAQLSRYGFDGTVIKKLPLGYIRDISNGGSLSDFLASPTNNVFNVENATKRIIFKSSIYSSLNPAGTVTRLSHDGMTRIAAGNPIDDEGIYLRQPNGSVYFYNPTAQRYHSVPNMNVYRCWGIGESVSTIRYYKVARSDYISSSPTSSLDCGLYSSTLVKHTMLDRGKRYDIPQDAGVVFVQRHPDLEPLLNRVPSGGTLSRAVGSRSSPTVWYIENGQRRPIPSVNNLILLGYNSKNISYLDSYQVGLMPASSERKLGTGQIVKSPDSKTVFVVNGDSRLSISSVEDFSDSRFKWKNLEVYEQSFLDSSYPWTTSSRLSRFLKDSNSENIYTVGGAETCYTSPDDKLMHLGIDPSAVRSQSFTTSVLPGLPKLTCVKLSSYIKSPSKATVYFVNDGVKYAFTSLQKYIDHNSTKESLSIIDQATIDSISTGQAI